MAIRNILMDGNPRLRKQSRPVEEITPKLLELLDDMAQTMYNARGLGLAAPQVGILRRIVVIDIGDGIIELINPRIVRADGEQRVEEGCLSIPDLHGLLIRPARVVVQATDRRGKKFKIKGEGLLAKALCHEIDHLDGILITDKMIARTDTVK